MYELLVALEIEAQGSNFEDLVTEGFAKARQGAVLVVEARGFHPTRVRWLGQALERTHGCLVVLRVQLEGVNEPWVTKVKADVERLLD